MLNGLESVPSESAEYRETDENRATRLVACIAIRTAGEPASRPGAAPKPMALRFAMRQLEKVVRSGDRICPVGTSRVAIEFAPAACGVPPLVLGDRLAEAIGGYLPMDSHVTELAVSVGLATPEQHERPSDLTRRALSAAQAGASHLDRRPGAGRPTPTSIVTVDRLLTPRWSATTEGQTFQSIHRRNIYDGGNATVAVDHALGVEAWTNGTAQGANGSANNKRPTSKPRVSHPPLTVLIADPMSAQIGYPGLAAATTVSIVESLGCRTASVAVSPDRPLALDVDGEPLDLVVLVLDGGWVGHSTSWSQSAWGVPARLAASYRAAGVPVLVVSAGAGAGAMASCVAQGAKALFSMEQLPDALYARTVEYDGRALPAVEVRLPSRFKALVGLTVSERRVLFYLTEGWAAQDIAGELVVSLTTVRSHIRSVLRKLGVRSQLAAVAIANSRDLDHGDSVDPCP